MLLRTINNPQEVLEVRRRAVESISFSGEEGMRKIIEAAYQGYGYRRVKNPRIWSLHDIAILGEEER